MNDAELKKIQEHEEFNRDLERLTAGELRGVARRFKAELDLLGADNARLRTAITSWIRSAEALGQVGAAAMMRDALKAGQ